MLRGRLRVFVHNVLRAHVVLVAFSMSLSILVLTYIHICYIYCTMYCLAMRVYQDDDDDNVDDHLSHSH